MMERWFALLTERQLRRGVHRSTKELKAAINHFIENHNLEPKPFILHKTADQILDSVARSCKRINNSGHYYYCVTSWIPVHDKYDGVVYERLYLCGMSAKTGTLVARQQRLTSYLDRLAEASGHVDRAVPLKLYCTGLLLPGERKSVEPMAARLAPDNVRRMHQSLHHVVADAPWSDGVLLGCTRNYALAACHQISQMRVAAK
jgi:hypothetical protein